MKVPCITIYFCFLIGLFVPWIVVFVIGLQLEDKTTAIVSGSVFGGLVFIGIVFAAIEYFSTQSKT